MKGKSDPYRRRTARFSGPDPEAVATAAFVAIAADPDRLGRFLAATGIDPARIRAAASEPGFLPAVLDYVVADEALLLAVASAIDVSPERVAAARATLSPEPDPEP